MRTFLLSAKKNKNKIKMKKESNIKFCMMNADLKIEPAPILRRSSILNHYFDIGNCLRWRTAEATTHMTNRITIGAGAATKMRRKDTDS
jgi:hypothetical protein